MTKEDKLIRKVKLATKIVLKEDEQLFKELGKENKTNSQKSKSSILNEKAQDFSDGVANRSSVEQSSDTNDWRGEKGNVEDFDDGLTQVAERQINVSDELNDKINEYFSKGNKKRGEVLVINAMALIEGFTQGRRQAIEEVEKMIYDMMQNCPIYTTEKDCWCKPLEELEQKLKEMQTR